jgi:hypothetical protein
MLYVRWAVNNSSTTPAGALQAFVKVDDGTVWQRYWDIDNLDGKHYWWETNYSVGPLTAGTHTITLVADPSNQVAEGNESDNSYTKTIYINPRPDFVVTAVSLSPASPSPGATFTAYVTVKNQGGKGDGGWLDVWTDNSVLEDCSSTEGGDDWASVGTLAAGASKRITLSGLRAPTTGSSWTFQARVNTFCLASESDDSNNNYFLAYWPPPPDFAVTRLSLSPSHPQNGQAFTAYVTVKNLGGPGAPETIGAWMDQPITQNWNSVCDNEWVLGDTLGMGQSKTYMLQNLTAVGNGPRRTFRVYANIGLANPDEPTSKLGNNQLTITY